MSHLNFLLPLIFIIIFIIYFSFDGYKNIDNNLSNVSITDTGSGILVDYAIDYFDEIYAGSPVIAF